MHKIKKCIKNNYQKLFNIQKKQLEYYLKDLNVRFVIKYFNKMKKENLYNHV